MSIPLGLGAAVVADVDLAAENRLDSDLSGLPVELNSPGERAVVGEPDSRHLELSSPSRKGRDAARPVEDRVLGVDVKVDERRFRHGQPILVGRSASALRGPLQPEAGSASTGNADLGACSSDDFWHASIHLDEACYAERASAEAGLR